MMLICNDREEVDAFFQRLRDSVQIDGAEKISCTISVGAAVLGVPAANDTPQSVLKRADEAMYQAKRTGKARCVMVDLTAPPQAA